MAKLEQEYRDWETDLLAQISDMDNRALLYEERLNEHTSTNSRMREALCNQESGAEAHINAVQQQLDAALQYQATLNAQITTLQGELHVALAAAVTCGSRG
jgi:hypothetical protein